MPKGDFSISDADSVVGTESIDVAFSELSDWSGMVKFSAVITKEPSLPLMPIVYVFKFTQADTITNDYTQQTSGLQSLLRP